MRGFCHHGTPGLAPDGAPLLLTEGWREYLTAWLTHAGPWVQPARRDKGPAPQPRWRPLPGLLSAPGVQTGRRWRLVDVQHRLVFGSSVSHAGPSRGAR
jgi:hypothetical protein